MKFEEVVSPGDKRRFLDFVDVIYKNDPNYIRPLDAEIEAVFDATKNSFFQHGKAIRWNLLDNTGRMAGRVAAFINEKKAWTFQQPTGGMGFFECIDDMAVAELLFDKCREWLTAHGMQAMDGPINFGENDVNWGLLVEGFTPPGIGMAYNPPYYRQLFEKYGFTFYFEQVSNHLDLTKPFPERFWKIAEWSMRKPEITFRHFTFKEADKFIHDMKEVYDDAWQFHENFTPMNEATLKLGLEKAKAFLDPELIWYVYHHEEPIAFLVQFPDVNQILRHLHGKLHVFNKLRFLWLKHRKTMTRTRIVIMGVKPKYQRYGVESGIFWHLNEVISRKPHITEMELSWVGDFNPKMRALHESVGATFAKRHITYRKLFSGAGSGQRSVIIPVNTREQTIKK